MDVDASIEEDEVAHALAAAKALSNKGDKSSSCFPDIADSLQELDMDHYDDEDDGTEFSSTILLKLKNWTLFPLIHLLYQESSYLVPV